MGAMFGQNVGQQPQQQTAQAGQFSQNPDPNANGAVGIPEQFNSSAAASQASAFQTAAGQQNANSQYAMWYAAMQQQ